VTDYSDRYDYSGDVRMSEIGEGAQARGYFTREECLEMVNWKSRGRQRRNAQRNSAEAIPTATEVLVGSDDDRDWLRAMRGLHGVQIPTASVFRHFTRRDCPILDRRALQALGVDNPPRHYPLAFWDAFATTCASLQEQGGVSFRILDRAMWAWSKLRGQAAERHLPPGATPRIARPLVR